ncbi:MAG: hypothetical protein NTZ81_04590 [Actinobacteria bacterium]|nr:hypothetical protein [Actinomycetota bacterium]
MIGGAWRGTQGDAQADHERDHRHEPGVALKDERQHSERDDSGDESSAEQGGPVEQLVGQRRARDDQWATTRSDQDGANYA